MENGRRIVRFGVFEADLQAQELRKFGVRIKLQRQPFQILAILLESAGEVVARKEFQRRLWPANEFTDFDHGLNKGVNKLREILNDSREAPRYIETLPRVGYRFVAPVEVANGAPATGPDSVMIAASVAGADATPRTLEVNPVARPYSRRAYVLLAAAFTLLLAVSFILAAASWNTGPRATKLRAILPLAGDLKLISFGDYEGMALSPDGTRLVFSAADNEGRPMLWLRQLDSPQATPLPGSDRGGYPFWSPDGGSVAFFVKDALKRFDFAAKTVRTIAHAAAGRGGSWSPKGVILFSASSKDCIYRVSAEGGKATPVTRLATPFTTHRFPEFLPDGVHFVFIAASHDRPSEPASLFLASLDGSAVTFLARTDSRALVVGDRLIFVAVDKFVVQTIDLRDFSLKGRAEVIDNDVQVDHGTWFGSFAASGSTLIYSTRVEGGQLQDVAWYDASGRHLRDVVRPGVYHDISLSPNQQSIAASCGDPDQTICLILKDGAITHVPTAPICEAPVWSPDSKRLAYRCFYQPPHRRTVIKVLDASADELHPDIGEESQIVAWHPDGYRLLVWHFPGMGQAESSLDEYDLRSQRLIPYLSLPADARVGSFSPDGKWLALTTGSSGADDVKIVSFPDPSKQYDVPARASSSPHWRADGKELYVVGPKKTMLAIPIVTKGDGLQIGSMRSLFSQPGIATDPRNVFDVDSRGERFLIATEHPQNKPDLVVVANWLPTQH